MENFNVVVLMKKDRLTGFLTDTIDSYIISSNINYIKNIYLLEESDDYYIYLSITTDDVENWEYYGIYDLYNEEILVKFGIEVFDGSGDYNPTWILRFPYSENRIEVEEKINKIVQAHADELNRILPIVKVNKDKYIKLAEEQE